MSLSIGIVIGLLITGVILFVLLKNNAKKISSDEKEIAVLKDSIDNSFPIIQIVENNKIIPSEKNKITDSNIKDAIATIDNVLPKSAIIANNVKSGTKLLDNNRAFFSAVRKGTENMQPVGKTGKIYGSQMIKDKSSNRMLYNAQTEFTREDALVKSAGKNALVNAGFNTASLVVGQYYMNEINNKLEDIKNDINEISDYLDSEYQGKVMHIVSKLKEITDNKIEILNNEFSTKKRYDEMIDLESECGILLGQANDEINKKIPNEDIEYKEYEKKLKNISKWFARQQLLQRLLLEIGNLRYVLACGNETSKLSHTQYNFYLEQTNSINGQLETLHIKMSKEYGIDINKSRRTGKFYKIRKNTVGRIKEDWAYHKLDDNTINMIASQTNIKKLTPYTKEKQDEVIKIQKYNGEYYNLLEE